MIKNFKTAVWWFALCVFTSGWMGVALLQSELEDARSQHEDAERRMGECIDIAADARDNALMLEDMWDRAVTELGHCEFWEEYGDGMTGGRCLGPEYWTSYQYGGP